MTDSGAWERAAAIQLRGLGYHLAKDYVAAIAAFNEALELDRATTLENEDVATGLNYRAEVERASGDFTSAERDFQEALRIAKKVNYREGVVSYTGNLANLALDQNQWIEAEEWAREALSLSEALGRLESIAINCALLSKAFARQGRQIEGLPYAQRAVAIFTKLRHRDLAEAQATLKECEDAKECLTEN